MSAKRPATFSVDEKTLQPSEDNNLKPSTEGEGTAERLIVKVKKDQTPVQPTETKPEETKLLFQGLFKNNGVGLFNNNTNIASLFPPPKNSPPIDLNNPNLFSGNGTKATGLFGNSASSNTGSLFGFKDSASIPPVRAGEDDEEGDSADLEKGQEMNIDKSKSKGHYEYKDELRTLFTGHVKKYKRNTGDLIQGLEVLVQIKQDEPKGKVQKKEGEKEQEEKKEQVPKTVVLILVVRLPATKHPILSGLLLAGSEVKVLNKKQENVEVILCLLGPDKKPIKEKIKLQFDSAELGKKFIETVYERLPSIVKSDEKNEEKHDNNNNGKQEKGKQV